MDRNIKGHRLAPLLALSIALLAAACSTVEEGPPAPGPSPAVLSVSGYITEVEDGKMSLRTFDNLRQLVFTLDSVQGVSTEYLAGRMQARQPVRVTYRVEVGRLAPISIESENPAPLSPTPAPYDY